VRRTNSIDNKIDLENSNAVKNWRRYLLARGKGSRGFWKVSYFILRKVLERCGFKDADELVDYARKDPEGFENKILELLAELKEKGKSEGYRSVYAKIMRSLLKANKVYIDIPVPGRRIMKATRAFTKDELKKAFDLSHSVKIKAFIALAKDSGLNPDELISMNVGDIRPILEKKNDNFFALPRVRRKSSVKYYLCVGPEGAKWLREYMAQRERIKKAPLEDNEPLFTDRTGKKRTTYDVIRHEFNRIKKEAGLDKELTIYSIRKFTLTKLRIAGMNESLAKRITAHSAGIEDFYLDPSKEEILEAYKKAYSEISLEGNGVTVQILQARLKDIEQERELLKKQIEELTKGNENLSLIVKKNERLLSLIIAQDPELKEKLKEDKELEEILKQI